MKKSLFIIVTVILFTMTFGGCGNVGSSSSVPDAYIGKWDMTNDKSSGIQQTIELKEDGTFLEHWIAYTDDGEVFGELEIQGCFERPVTEGNQKALCLIYDLATLNDEAGILEAIDDTDHFKKNNDEYEAAKKRNKVYGYQSAYVEGTTLSFKGGKWKLIDEDMEKLFRDSN